MIANPFPKIVPFKRSCGRIWQCRAGHGRQYNAARALCILVN